MVGGSGRFYSYQLKNVNSNQKGIVFELRPNLGCFINDKFAVGITPLFTYNKTENSNSTVSYGIGSYARYYLLKTEKRVNVLTHIGYSYNGNDNTNDTSMGFDFKVGPVIFFNSSVALEMTLNYNTNNQNSATYNIFSLGLGLQIHLEK